MAVDCRKCEHFRITWEKNRPYACKAFGFKSLKIPSAEVLINSGRECLKFSQKKLNKK